jgi:PD-(D/E)XK endonuclease
VLTTDQKGSIGEAAITAKAIKLGIDVYKPINDGTRCDFIFGIRNDLVRVQCKWAARHGEVLVVRCYSCRRTSDGQLRRPYTAGEIDAFAAYCMDIDRCYFFPFEAMAGRPPCGCA